MLIEYVTVRQLSFPLIRPYKRSNSSSDVFDPYVIEGLGSSKYCFLDHKLTSC